VLGQHLGVRATLSPDGMTDERRSELGQDRFALEQENDRVNRESFEENIDLVVRAWTQDSIEHASARWQVPYPHDAGIDWLMHRETARLGAPGEIGPDGNVRRISVVPAPYTRPHPPVFVASNASPSTVEYCGTRGFIPTYFSGVGRAGPLGRRYVERAREAGEELELGRKQAIVRWMQIGRTTDAARAAVEAYDLEIYRNLYKPLTPVMPMDDARPVQSVLDSGLWVCGTAAEVRDQFVAQWRELPAEYLVLVCHYAQQPLESVVENLEQFMRHVKPALDELTDFAEPAGAAAAS